MYFNLRHCIALLTEHQHDCSLFLRALIMWIDQRSRIFNIWRHINLQIISKKNILSEIMLSLSQGLSRIIFLSNIFSLFSLSLSVYIQDKMNKTSVFRRISFLKVSFWTIVHHFQADVRESQCFIEGCRKCNENWKAIDDWIIF